MAESTPPPVVGDRFDIFNQTMADVTLLKATTSTITPLISVISSGIRMLYNSRRHGDVRQLIFLPQADIGMCRLIARLLEHRRHAIPRFLTLEVWFNSCVIYPTLKKRARHLSILCNTHTTNSPFARQPRILSYWRSTMSHRWPFSVTGKTRQKVKEPENLRGKRGEESNSTINALEAAREILVTWKVL